MTREFVITDLATDTWVESAMIPAADLLPGCRVEKRTLRGGLRDGVEVLDVSNGELSFSILPTRGMGLWRGEYRGITLGWKAPIIGPVHPKFVDFHDRNGIGWLQGFDEWMCRVGLASNGPPGDDGGRPLTLHGRIANQPAHCVSVSVEEHQLCVRGEVEEGGLFYPRLRLSTRYATLAGSNRIDIRDEVTNLGGTPTEMQLLYHCNFGPPLLGPGSRVLVPVREMWPMTAKAAAAMEHMSEYEPPNPGFVEEVFCAFPEPDANGKSLAMLHDATASKAIVLRWPIDSLPCFTIWKNTAALEDGYVTGLEPATNFPQFRAKERAAGRVRTLAPGERWTAEWSMEVLDRPSTVERVIEEIAKLQTQTSPIHHTTPLADQ